jgi:hypothetical protein
MKLSELKPPEGRQITKLPLGGFLCVANEMFSLDGKVIKLETY